MNDFLGKELKVGDNVVGIVGKMDKSLRFATNSFFSGSVVSFSKQRVTLDVNGRKVVRAPYKVVIIS